MYNTSKPSSTTSTCNVRIISHQEYFCQRRENFDVTDKVVEGERTKQSVVDVSHQAVDTGNVTVNRRMSSSVSDTADINSNVGLQTSRPVCCSEKCGAVETDRTDAKDDPLECGTGKQVSDVEMLDFISSALSSSRTTELLEANNKCADDDTVGSVVNDDDKDSGHDGLRQNDAAVLPKLTSEEKIGFEPDAITAADQWPPPLPVVERKVRRLQTEVQRLLFDERGSGMKRELRTSGRSLGGVRRKTRRSPLLRLRTTVSLRPSSSSRCPNRLSGRVSSKSN